MSSFCSGAHENARIAEIIIIVIRSDFISLYYLLINTLSSATEISVPDFSATIRLLKLSTVTAIDSPEGGTVRLFDE
jgi:hypothetical protein